MNPLCWAVPLAFIVGGVLGMLTMALCAMAGRDEQRKGADQF